MPKTRKTTFSKKPPKRVFKKIDHQQSQIFVIKYRGKRRLVRITSSGKPGAERLFSKMKIFNILFSENSIKPIAVTSLNVEGRKSYYIKLHDFHVLKIPVGKQFGIVSDILKNRSNDYKEFQQWFYLSRKKHIPMTEAVRRHLNFVEQVALPLRQEIADKTGIHLSKHPANICNVNDKPVFFEIDYIRAYNLSKFIACLETGRRKKQLLSLLKEPYF